MIKTFTKNKQKSILPIHTDDLELTFDEAQFYKGVAYKLDRLISPVSTETINKILAYSKQKKSL
jgi:hypothetical protein